MNQFQNMQSSGLLKDYYPEDVKREALGQALKDRLNRSNKKKKMQVDPFGQNPENEEQEGE
jgi:hypothetical protein